jgi:hypothetical protein
MTPRRVEINLGELIGGVATAAGAVSTGFAEAAMIMAAVVDGVAASVSPP